MLLVYKFQNGEEKTALGKARHGISQDQSVPSCMWTSAYLKEMEKCDRIDTCIMLPKI